MPDLPSVTNFINSPSGQLVAGAALAGIVWKFFDKVEGVLTDQTKFEIAVWLVGVKLGQSVESWPETCAAIFDRVFGKEHLSWKCFWRSSIISLIFGSVAWTLATISLNSFLWSSTAEMGSFRQRAIPNLFLAMFFNIVPDYASLLATRAFLSLVRRNIRSRTVAFVLVLDLLVTTGIAAFPYYAATKLAFPSQLENMKLTATVMAYSNRPEIRYPLEGWDTFSYSSLEGGFSIGKDHSPEYKRLVVSLARAYRFADIKKVNQLEREIDSHFSVSALESVMLPSIWTSIFLWLYGLSGLVIRLFRHLDIGFQWFNRKFDIEKKPLSAIGLVAGSLVAILYWAWAGFRHFYPA